MIKWTFSNSQKVHQYQWLFPPLYHTLFFSQNSFHNFFFPQVLLSQWFMLLSLAKWPSHSLSPFTSKHPLPYISTIVNFYLQISLCDNFPMFWLVIFPSTCNSFTKNKVICWTSICLPTFFYAVPCSKTTKILPRTLVTVTSPPHFQIPIFG